MLGLIFLVGISFLLYLFTVIRSTGLANANAIFVYAQTLMAIGTLVLTDPMVPADRVYSDLVVWCLLSYLVVSAGVLLWTPSNILGRTHERLRTDSVSLYQPRGAVVGLIGLSICIVVGYYYAIGYSAFVEGLVNSLTGGSLDVAGQRLDSYAGARYLFPGYVNQFKNVILPSLVVITVVWWAKKGTRHWFLGLGLVALAAFGLIGTGQRGAFIRFGITTLLFMYFYNGHRLGKGVFRVGLASLGIVIVSTIALGRNSVGLGANPDVIDRVWAAVRDLADRIVFGQSVSAIAGFRFIIGQPVQWGGEWLRAMLGILPGERGSSLSNRIFAELYGSMRGTSPASVWGSVYYNFGLVGVGIFPAAFAVLVGSISKATMMRRSRNTLQLFGMAGISTTLGFWVSGSPESLLNAGLPAYVALWVWGVSAQKRSTDDALRYGVRFRAGVDIGG